MKIFSKRNKTPVPISPEADVEEEFAIVGFQYTVLLDKYSEEQRVVWVDRFWNKTLCGFGSKITLPGPEWVLGETKLNFSLSFGIVPASIVPNFMDLAAGDSIAIFPENFHFAFLPKVSVTKLNNLFLSTEKLEAIKVMLSLTSKYLGGEETKNLSEGNQNIVNLTNVYGNQILGILNSSNF